MFCIFESVSLCKETICGLFHLYNKNELKRHKKFHIKLVIMLSLITDKLSLQNVKILI